MIEVKKVGDTFWTCVFTTYIFSIFKHFDQGYKKSTIKWSGILFCTFPTEMQNLKMKFKMWYLNTLKMIQNNLNQSFSHRTFDPRSMVIFGYIGARFMPDFRFEKLFLDLSPWKIFF